MDYDETVAAWRAFAGRDVSVETIIDGALMHSLASGVLELPEPHFYLTPVGYKPPFAVDQAVFRVGNVTFFVNRDDFVAGNVDEDIVVLQLSSGVEMSMGEVLEIEPLASEPTLPPSSR